MAKVYYELIIKGLKTIDDVPEKLKEQVQELLDSDSNDNQNFTIYSTSHERGERNGCNLCNFDCQGKENI